MDPIAGRPLFSSWSGGKDSCLALYNAIQNGGIPKSLFTMMDKGGKRSHSHGLPKSLLKEQARQLGIPITFRSASWDGYETAFLEALDEFRKNGIGTGVFGDIDIDSNREWVRRVCDSTGVVPFHPLWQRPRRALLEEFIALGFEATIIVIENDKLNISYLGKTIDPKTIDRMERAGIDASGELGEYHTIVTAGPIFSSNVQLNINGRQIVDGYSLLETTGPEEMVSDRKTGDA